MTHPTLTRASAACARIGSKATTTRGMIRAIRAAGARILPLPDATCRPYWYCAHTQGMRAQRIAKIATGTDVSRYTADARAAVGVRQLQAELRTSYPYASPSGSWAGGNVRLTVHVGVPSASATTDRVWSANGKWSGNDLAVRLCVSERALLSDLDLTAAGLVILDAELIAPGEYQAKWATQKGQLGLTVISGWLIRGYHSTKKTIEAARKEARAAREKALAAELAVRQRDAVLAHIWINVADSDAAGNCAAGTEAFRRLAVSRLVPDGEIGAIRADWALSIRDDMFVRRAIAVAQRRAVSA